MLLVIASFTLGQWNRLGGEGVKVEGSDPLGVHGECRQHPRVGGEKSIDSAITAPWIQCPRTSLPKVWVASYSSISVTFLKTQQIAS